MIIVEITERGRRKASRVIFNDNGLADSFETHARASGALTVRLPETVAREHLGSLRERAARRSEWRAGNSPPSAESAGQIAAAKANQKQRDVEVSVRVPRAVKAELDRIAKVAGRAPEQIIRASIAAFIKAARE